MGVSKVGVHLSQEPQYVTPADNLDLLHVSGVCIAIY